jgi:hypothetical protein
LVIKTLDPDRYSAYNAGSGSGNEYGSETLIYITEIHTVLNFKNMRKEGRLYGWSTEGWKPTKGCLSQPWPCSSGSFLLNAEKYTRLTLLPRILPAGRNFGQITEIKLTGKLELFKKILL